VLPSAASSCHFCDSSLAGNAWLAKESRATPFRGNLALDPDFQGALISPIANLAEPVDPSKAELAWRHELAKKLESYRGRRRKSTSSAAQTRFSFYGTSEEPVATTESNPPAGTHEADQDFSFTVAIGRSSNKPQDEKPHLLIDLSAAASDYPVDGVVPERPDSRSHAGIYPIASIDDRRFAAILDSAFLLFAYGGFLTLFGSLGGQFTFSKLSAGVYAVSLAIIYFQYFALFTIFGGTTPGMMLRGLQVVSYSGQPPSPRQAGLRSLGYLISAATFGLGYLWALWDEDGLTWHDRLSETYLTSQQGLVHADPPATLHPSSPGLDN
jgi:uncharacterized RDD family membrane protein YckC